MKKLLVVLLCLWLVGCATYSGIRNKNRENINRLSLGMSKQEVSDIMGTETVTATPGLMAGVVSLGASNMANEKISNPYKTEVLTTEEGKTLEVLYYYTDVQSRDGALTDDELTPVILEDNKVIGWGRSFLDKNIDKHELRIR